MWDSSLGFPGEGPSWSSLRNRPVVEVPSPTTIHFQPGMKVEHVFISNARSILAGDSRAKGPASQIRDGHIQRRNRKSAYGVGHRREFGPAGGGSISIPPDKRQKLSRGQHIPSRQSQLGGEWRTGSTGGHSSGVVHDHLQLALDQELAASAEIARLFNTCQAIERAPSHDGDKCLRSWALTYERQVLPRGQWPQEPIIPLCDGFGSGKYNRDQMSTVSHAAGRGQAPARLRERSVHRREERRRLQLMHGLPGTEQVRGEIQVPDGGSAGSGGVDPATRLRHARRPQGRVSDAGSAPLAQEVLSLPVPENEGSLPMEDSIVRDLGGSENMHEDHPPTDSNTEVIGDTVHHLHRRPSSSRPGPSPSGKGDGNRNGPVTKAGGSTVKIVKGKLVSLPGVHMPGHHLGHTTNDMPHTCKTHQGLAGISSSDTQDVVRRSSRPHSRLGTFRGASGVHVSGNTTSQETPPVVHTRIVESSRGGGWNGKCAISQRQGKLCSGG